MERMRVLCPPSPGDWGRSQLRRVMIRGAVRDCVTPCCTPVMWPVTHDDGYPLNPGRVQTGRIAQQCVSALILLLSTA